MSRNNFSCFNPRRYEELLSPFGRQVLGTLIKQWNAGKNGHDRIINDPPIRHNNARRRVITFEGPSNRNNAYCGAVNSEVDLCDDRPFEFLSTENYARPLLPESEVSLFTLEAPPTFTPPAPPVMLGPPPVVTRPAFNPSSNQTHLPIPTSTELVNIADISTKTNDINLSREDLIATVDNANEINESRDIFDNVEDGIYDDVKLDDAIDKARNVWDKCATNVNWDDMFDTDLLPDLEMPISQMADTVNKHNNNAKDFHITFPKDKSSNVHHKKRDEYKEPKRGTDAKGSKRKNQPRVTDAIPKKVKKIKTEVKLKSKALPKTIVRKEKLTDSVNNWLNDVDSNNPVEDILNPLEASELKSTKDKPEIVVQIRPTEKPKKTVQTQLANKGGIMKFGKPSKNLDENSNEASKTETTTSESKPKDKEKVKEKKLKSKFVAPIKSQIPVKDLTYEIQDINETSIRELKLPIHSTRDQEMIVLLLYSNGFCQLNNQHTDDACVPEALMFNFNDRFFYLKDGGAKIADVIAQLLQNNTMICYDGKALLMYLTSKLELDFDTTCSFNVIDVKIAGCLLEPDSPPETFSALQRLTRSEPEFTIATTCVKQKAAWYSTLLSATSTAVREKLETEDLWQVFVNIEMGILPIIADMEQRGVCVDMDRLKEMEKILVTKMKQVESECAVAAGRSFQINSTVQVRALLYDELRLDEKAGLKVRGTLTTGAKSTSETMLKSLVSVHPLPRLILEYRHLHKAHATFLHGVAQYVRAGVVRPVWVQTAAATGRIASSNPNLQAIPKVPFSLRLFPENGVGQDHDPAAESLRFRSVYVSRPGYVMLAADWRHVECRVFARAAADTSLQRALEAPDLFRRLAADWLKKPEEDVSSADRERTKRIVYASLYGAGPRKLMDILDVDYAQALSIAASFDRTFPSLRSFGRRVASQCLSAGGRVATLCGRTRTLSHITSADAAQRSHAERQALNFIVQGSAADVCKLAMSSAVRALRARGLRAHLLLQIHDELVWEVKEDDLPQAAEVIRTAMEQCGARAGLTSLPVALAAGRNWGQLAPYPPVAPTPSEGGDWESQPELLFEP